MGTVFWPFVMADLCDGGPESPKWPIMCWVGRYTLLNLNLGWRMSVLSTWPSQPGTRGTWCSKCTWHWPQTLPPHTLFSSHRRLVCPNVFFVPALLRFHTVLNPAAAAAACCIRLWTSLLQSMSYVTIYSNSSTFPQQLRRAPCADRWLSKSFTAGTYVPGPSKLAAFAIGLLIP